MDTSNDRLTVGPSVFMPHKHPELRQLGSKSIQTFLRQREQYLLKAEDAVAQGSTYKPMSLVNSVVFKLLKALVAFDTFQNVKAVSDLTDDVLLNWLKSQIEGTILTFTPDELEALIRKNVSIKMKEHDPKIRVMSLFLDYYTFLEERNLQHLINNNTKTSVKHICALLRPAGFKQKIENDLALEKAHLKKDWKAFYAHVIEDAVAFEKYYSSVMQTQAEDSAKGSLRRDTRGRVPRKGSREPTDGLTPPSEGSKTEADHAPADGANKDRPERQGNVPRDTCGRKIPFCLNKETCPNEHDLIRDCGKTSEEKKKELLAEHRRKKRQQLPGIKLVRFTDTVPFEDASAPLPLCNDGRIEAVLADSVPVVVSGDYGSNHAALSEEHLAKLADANVFVSVLTFQQPISMQLAVGGSDEQLTITAERKARISTTLSTMEGPFRLRNVECLVFKEHMLEVLLSRPILQSLGFNLDHHLARVRAKFHDADRSNIGFEPDKDMTTAGNQPEGRLSRLLREVPTNTATYFHEDDEHAPQKAEQMTNPILTEQDSFLDVGRHTPQDVTQHLDRMYSEALDNGLPHTLAARLRRLLDDYKDVFRVKLGSDPPVRIAPMNIRLHPGATPVRVKVRRYSAPEEFLRDKIQELQQLGLVRRNTQSAWACAPLIVPKPGPEGFRFTTDLRPVNKVIIPHAWPIPHLETFLTKLANQNCFSSIDLCHGYWQFSLAESSQECQSFITPEGVYTPTRVMHGQHNAVAYCQSSVQAMCEPLRDKLLAWLDDILLHDENPDDLLDTLEAFFQLCLQYNLKLHAAKCRLFLTEVRWCGRLINSEGVRMDPARLNALLEMRSPSTADQLQQFVCAAGWMRAGIPQYTTLIAPLAALLEQIYQRIGSRTRRRVSKIKLMDMGWDTVHETAFQNVKQALANSVALAHPDPEKLF